MDVQAIRHKIPMRGCRITRDGLLHVTHKVGFRAGVATARRDDLPDHDVQINNEGLRAVTSIFKLAALDMMRLQRQIGCGSFQGLNPTHLIGTERPLALFGSFGRGRVHFGDVLDLVLQIRVTRRRQPVTTLMRLQVRFVQQSPDVSSRNAGDDLTLAHLVRDFARGPLTNGTIRFGGVLTRNREHMRQLFGRELGRSARSFRILQTGPHRLILLGSLQPVISPMPRHLTAEVQLSRNLTMGLARVRIQDDLRSARDLLRRLVLIHQLFQFKPFILCQTQWTGPQTWHTHLTSERIGADYASQLSQHKMVGGFTPNYTR